MKKSLKTKALLLVSGALAVIVMCSTLISYIFYTNALDGYVRESVKEESKGQFFVIFTCTMVILAIILVVITAILLEIYFIKPVTDMTKAISSITYSEAGMSEGEEGEQALTLKDLDIESGDEMEELYHALLKFRLDTAEYLLSIREDSWEREHDSMTMLSNRVKFDKRKTEVYPYADSIYIACLNVINMHVVNSEISTEAGDGIISKVARELRRLSSENIHTYRLEEDHFMVVFCGYLEEEAISVITKWVERVGRLNRNSDNFECRLSWGGCFGEGIFDVDDIYKHADTELYCSTALAKKEIAGKK